MTNYRNAALALINSALAQPMTHVVLTTYADGRVARQEMRGLKQANNWADLERRKIGRKLVSRNSDMTAGPIVVVTSVEVLSLA